MRIPEDNNRQSAVTPVTKPRFEYREYILSRLQAAKQQKAAQALEKQSAEASEGLATDGDRVTADAASALSLNTNQSDSNQSEAATSGEVSHANLLPPPPPPAEAAAAPAGPAAESMTEFDRQAMKARRLAGQVGEKWPLYVERAIEAGDQAGLQSMLAALQKKKTGTTG
jgi:hypothetical protein